MTTWGRHDDADVAVDRILDAAGRIHLRKGVRSTTMADIAAEAGCSRATLYLYFPNRAELRGAVRNRAAIEVAEQIAARTSHLDDDAQRVTRAALLALELVRSTPELAVWFDSEDAGLTHELATSSDVIDAIAIGLSNGAEPPTRDARARARLLVRVIVSYLISPDPEHEAAAIGLLVAGTLAPHQPAPQEHRP